MRKLPRIALAAVLGVGGITLVQAQQQQAQPEMQAEAKPEDQAKQLERIASFIGENTVAVAKLDLSELDLKATEQWLTGFIKTAEPNPQLQQEQIGRLQQQVQKTEDWVGKMRQAGAETIYAIITRQPVEQQAAGQQAPAPKQPQAQPGEAQPQQPATQPIVLTTAIVVPLDPEDNRQSIEELLLPQEPARRGPMAQNLSTAVIRDAVVLAPQEMVANLQQPAKGDVQAIEKALSAVSGSGIQFAFVPTAQMKETARAMAEQTGQNLPQGVTPQDLVKIPQGLEWAALGIDSPPEQRIKLIVDATNPQAAQDISNTINKLLQAARQDPDLAAQVPNLEQVIKALTPTVEQDRVTLALNPQQVDVVFRENLAAAIRSVREQEPIRAGEIPGVENGVPEREQPEGIESPEEGRPQH